MYTNNWEGRQCRRLLKLPMEEVLRLDIGQELWELNTGVTWLMTTFWIVC
jgi:hypothetical protein